MLYGIKKEGKPDIKLKAIQETIQLQFEQQQQQLQQQSDPKAEYAKKVCPTCYFDDNYRRIDYVLVVDQAVLEDNFKKHYIINFLNYLMNYGAEYELQNGILCDNLVFIKLHEPLEMQLQLAKSYRYELNSTNPNFDVDKPSRAMKKIFDTQIHRMHWERPQFPTSVERAILFFHLFRHALFGTSTGDISIMSMIERKILKAAYPLHDGSAKWAPDAYQSERQLLARYWASYKRFLQRQPIYLIQRYFGEEVALYFAWLEFYNKSLVPAVVVGLFLFLVGALVAHFSYSTIRNEVCESALLLCPKCAHFSKCSFVQLKDSCRYMKLASLIDNSFTVLFAVFMSVWAAVYVACWKRRFHTLKFKFNVSAERDKATPRYLFYQTAKGVRVSKVTGLNEDYILLGEKMWRWATVYPAILFLCLLIFVVAMSVSIFFYKFKQRSMNSSEVHIRQHAYLHSCLLNAIMVVIYIQFLTPVYHWLSRQLTILECPRTEQEFERRFIYKSCGLSFANNYAGLVYLAFFRGKFYSNPGEERDWERLWGLKMDTCGPGGCLTDVGVQVFVILVVSGLFSILWQIIFPITVRYVKRMKYEKINFTLPRWEEEYFLNATYPYFLESEYRDLVTQFGFITCFAAACPLGPLLALTRNIFEVRVDAKKLLLHSRRPSSNQINTVEAFTSVLEVVTYFCIVTNACVIAFASNFFPVLIYRLSHGFKTEGYIESTLSEFDLEDYSSSNEVVLPPNITRCYYIGNRYPPDHPDEYHPTIKHYYEVVIKFVFVFLFEHLLLFLNGVISRMLPPVTRFVKESLARQEWNIRGAKEEILNKVYASKLSKPEKIRFPARKDKRTKK